MTVTEKSQNEKYTEKNLFLIYLKIIRSTTFFYDTKNINVRSRVRSYGRMFFQEEKIYS